MKTVSLRLDMVQFGSIRRESGRTDNDREWRVDERGRKFFDILKSQANNLKIAASEIGDVVTFLEEHDLQDSVSGYGHSREIWISVDEDSMNEMLEKGLVENSGSNH